MVNMLSHTVFQILNVVVLYTLLDVHIAVILGGLEFAVFDMMKLINIGKMMIILLMLTPCVTRKELCFICLTN